MLNKDSITDKTWNARSQSPRTRNRRRLLHQNNYKCSRSLWCNLLWT